VIHQGRFLPDEKMMKGERLPSRALPRIRSVRRDGVGPAKGL